MLNERRTYFPLPNGGKFLYEIMTFDHNMWGVKDHRHMTSREKKELELEEKNTCSRFLGSCGLDNAQRAFNRAKKRVFELLCSNSDLDMFVTVTVNFGDLDYGETVSRLGVWLDNQVRRKGLRYILVPEYNDECRELHFHGVMNESAITLVNSGLRRGRKAIYNVTSWRYGYTTAVRIGRKEADWQRVAHRIVDYMLKAEYGKIGGRYYLHGGRLAEPFYEYASVNYSSANGNETVINDYVRFKIERFL